MESVVDITSQFNWEIQIVQESLNKISTKSIEIKGIDIEPNGVIKFGHEENLSNEPIIAKFFYRREIVAAFVKKAKN